MNIRILFLVICCMCTISAHGAVCNAGFYLESGECVQCQPGYYCPGNDARGKCVGATYSETYGAIECTTCPISQNNSDNILRYAYHISGDIHSRRANCYVEFKFALKHGYTSRLACYVDADADTYGFNDSDSGIVCDSLPYDYTCDSGYWLAANKTGGQFAFKTVADAIENGCVPVETGFYSPDKSIYRTACPAGTHTIGFGVGADDVNDCGMTLYFGDGRLHLYAAPGTSPSLAVHVGDKFFYGNLKTGLHKGLCVILDGVEYCGYDDTTNK